MKKKIILSTLLVMFSICSVFAFDWVAAGGWHRYTDYKNGYSGLAKSYYIGTLKEINPDSFSEYLKKYITNEGVYNIKSIHGKLSKAEKFILISELNSWDLEDGDVYVARIQTGYGIQVIIASVDKKGSVTNWYGYDCEVKGF